MTGSSRIRVRDYEERDWATICRIHDAARLDELRDAAIFRPSPAELREEWTGPRDGDLSEGRTLVGPDAFLPLVSTFEAEDLFADDVRIAEYDGAVAGFIAGSDDEITWLYVDPAMWRRGIARALVTDHLRRGDGRRVELEVLEGNAARGFYEQLGFVVESTSTGRLAGAEEFWAVGHVMVNSASAS
ncbi:MAG TPA: GNAT family N-acetyltransferase [Microbacterium sp.]|nr:GNAT family N-acetyltransferase [Microbacterium sp.]